jgi:hypothetical protein
MKPHVFEPKKTPKIIKSYSPEEILAAGGTTAFSIKMGKDMDSLIAALENAEKPEPFTEAEWADLMADLARDK